MTSLMIQPRSVLIVGLVGCVLIAGLRMCIAEESEAAFVTGSDDRVAFIRQDSKLLLNAYDVATAFGWKADVVADGQILTLCQNADQGVCIPVRLNNVEFIRTETALFIEAKSLARPLRFRLHDVGGVVTLIPGAQESAEESETPAYNAAWGQGRGFGVGQTLPDIPLIDLEGREVRFSRFLGKQYIIYCWASW